MATAANPAVDDRAHRLMLACHELDQLQGRVNRRVAEAIDLLHTAHNASTKGRTSVATERIDEAIKVLSMLINHG